MKNLINRLKNESSTATLYNEYHPKGIATKSVYTIYDIENHIGDKVTITEHSESSYTIVREFKTDGTSNTTKIEFTKSEVVLTKGSTLVLNGYMGSVELWAKVTISKTTQKAICVVNGKKSSWIPRKAIITRGSKVIIQQWFYASVLV